MSAMVELAFGREDGHSWKMPCQPVHLSLISVEDVKRGRSEQQRALRRHHRVSFFTIKGIEVTGKTRQLAHALVAVERVSEHEHQHRHDGDQVSSQLLSGHDSQRRRRPGDLRRSQTSVLVVRTWCSCAAAKVDGPTRGSIEQIRQLHVEELGVFSSVPQLLIIACF